MPSLSTDLFDYALPERLIAQTPAARRDASRLLVVNRRERSFAHHAFADLPRFLHAGDTLFRNNAAVLPARLSARRPTGGQVECLLLRPTPGDGSSWHCLVKPCRRLAPGSTFEGAGGAFAGTVESRDPEGGAVVRFSTRDGRPISEVANDVGRMPLPPYIARPDGAANGLDRERYQTVYADPARRVAAAAPTAGLHFTAELLAALASQGVDTADLTLHVGLGTFKPISTPTVEEHAIHRETYEVPSATQARLFAPKGRRIAVGTTSARTIEHFLHGHPHPMPEGSTFVGEADLYIHPPHNFRGTDALITNFHQPRSTLLCLVAAFLAPGSTAGIAWLHELYAEAIRAEYRFFSYGDAMLIL